VIQHQQLGALLPVGLAAEQVPDDRQLAQNQDRRAVDLRDIVISPAMANDWPSRSSTSVSARRVVNAGMRKPCSVTPLLKSSELTSGATCRSDQISRDRRRGN
jgi:hypothetical protein